jgi:hypothetical protein
MRTMICSAGHYELWHEQEVASVGTGKTTGLHTIRCRHCGAQIGGGEARLVQMMWEIRDKDKPHEGCSGDA